MFHFAKPITLNHGSTLKIRSHANRLSEQVEPDGYNLLQTNADFVLLSLSVLYKVKTSARLNIL
jgi:hypothetical protein